MTWIICAVLPTQPWLACRLAQDADRSASEAGFPAPQGLHPSRLPGSGEAAGAPVCTDNVATGSPHALGAGRDHTTDQAAAAATWKAA